MNSISRNICARWVLAMALPLTACLPSAAHAQAGGERMSFDIPRLPLAEALNRFGTQAHVQMMFPYDLAAGHMSAPVSGRLTRQEALGRLLRNSGLRVVQDDGVTVSLRGEATGGAPAAAATDNDAIIVTAQHREQKALNVPFALTAYSGEALSELGVKTLRDASLYTPGLLIEDQSPNNPIFVLRGITSSGGDAFTEPRVSVFQDGVPISKSRGSFVELFDIARIEVAKGPQSTLFGRGALIGGVNVIQNHAGPRFDWAASGEVGNDGYRMIDGMINVPLSDAVAFRVSGRKRTRDGYEENLAPNAKGGLNGIDTDAVRGAIALRPGDRFSADLIVNYQHDETDGTGFKSMYKSPTDPATGQVLAGTGLTDPVYLSSPSDFENGEPLGVRQHYVGATALLHYKLTDALTLHSTTGWRDVDAVELYDADGTSLPLFTNREDDGGRTFNQELRLNYDDGGRFSWFVGGNYYRERSYSQVDVRFDERMLLAQLAGVLNGGPVLGLPASTPAPASLFDNNAFMGSIVQGLVAAQSGGKLALGSAQAAALAAQLDPGHVETNRNRSRLDSYDLFGDMTFHPTDRWEITAGLRYTHDAKTTSWSSSVAGRSVIGGLVGAAGIAKAGTPAALATAQALLQALQVYGHSLAGPLPLFGINAQPTPGNGSFASQDLSDSGLTWRVSTRYALSPSANLYGSYARGRRPDVLSAAAPGAPDGQPTFSLSPAEKVDAFEVGLKTDLRPQRLHFDVSTYYYTYQNFQTTELVGSSFVTTNAGKARSYGVEVQGGWRPVPMLELSATYAYNHSRFVFGAYEGNHFARSPDHMVSVAASLEAPIRSGLVYLRPNYVYRSKVFFSDDNDRPDLQRTRLVPDLIQDEFQNGFGLLNIRAGFETGDHRYTIEGFVTNATNKGYRKGAGSAGDNIGLPTQVRGEPRFFGLRVSIHQ